jgi:hypothetical protein
MMAFAGLLQRLSISGHFSATEQKPIFANFTVEKSSRTPYGTWQHICPAAPRATCGEKADLSPRVPCAEGREETLLF